MHAREDAFLDVSLEVIPKLLVELLIDALAPQERTQPEAQNREQTPNRVLQTVRTIKEIAAASRSHCAASFSSAFLPAFVNV